MSDETAVERVSEAAKSGMSPIVVHVLYIIAAFTAVPWLIGLIIAYVARGDADEINETHFTYQIRTFWIGLLYLIIGAVLSVAVIGIFICLFTWVWALVRSVKAFGLANRGEPIPNPKTWLW